MPTKYTKDILEPIIKSSLTWADSCRALKISTAGGSQAHIKSRTITFGIDYSHFKCRSWAKGQTLNNKQKDPDKILIKRPNSGRQKGSLLKRCLLAKNIKYECSICKIKEWQNQQITVEIDHIDGDPSNDIISNLRFLCPNCHSQTKTYKNKKR